MRLSKTWIVAARDFKIFRRVKNVWYSIIIFPGCYLGPVSSDTGVFNIKGEPRTRSAECASKFA